MGPTIFDLRAVNRLPILSGLLVAGLLTATAWHGVRTSGHVGFWVIAVVLTLLVLLGLLAVPDLFRARRLVIDHEGIRIDRNRRRPELRVAWTELAGVGLIRDDRQRQRRARRYRVNPLWEVPPGVVAVTVSLELVPTGPDAVRRHPEMARYRRLGHEEAWRVPLSTGPCEPLPIADALRLRRPDLWRGERSGPALLA